MLGVPNAITRSSDTYDNASAGSVASTLEDLGYSFADGMMDTHKWNLTAPFSSKGKIGTLSAPVKPLSEQLRVNPLDVKAPSAIPGAPLDPGQIKQDIGAGTQSVQGLQPLAVLPLSAPKSVLPTGLANPLDVKQTGGAVGTLDPSQVKAPASEASVLTQSIEVNPIDTTGGTSGDLSSSYSTDTAQQSASNSYYGSDNQQLATETSNIGTMTTAAGTDRTSYESANSSSVLNSSTTESSYAHEINNSVLQNVQSRFDERNLSYIPDTSVGATEANTAVNENGSSWVSGSWVERGRIG